MMNNLQEFNFKGNNVRTILLDGEPRFIGTDITKTLGYSNSRDALKRHVDDEDKSTVVIPDGTSGNPNKTVINESGLYSLILSSKLPAAKEFKRWVTSEVLPTIRKHGAYLTDSAIEQTLTDPDYLIKLATQLKTEREGRLIAEQQVETMRPKAIFADSVSVSDSTVSIGGMAKILRGNGVNIGRNRFYKWLRDNNYLIKQSGSDYNLPTQKSMDLGLFKIHESSEIDANGLAILNRTTNVTGIGQRYFIDKFLNVQITLNVN